MFIPPAGLEISISPRRHYSLCLFKLVFLLQFNLLSSQGFFFFFLRIYSLNSFTFSNLPIFQPLHFLVFLTVFYVFFKIKTHSLSFLKFLFFFRNIKQKILFVLWTCIFAMLSGFAGTFFSFFLFFSLLIFYGKLMEYSLVAYFSIKCFHLRKETQIRM